MRALGESAFLTLPLAPDPEPKVSLPLGRADRPRSAAGMGLPVTVFNTRSGTPSLREAKPDPVFRPRTSRDADPYLEAR